MYVARNITRAKWDAKQGLGEGEIPADAVTADLRTAENTLSFWRCGQGTEQEVLEAVLALTAGADRIDKIDVIWVSERDLRSDGQTLRFSRGRTPVASLVNSHVDVHRLDHVGLGLVAKRVAHAVAVNQYRRLTKRAVARCLKDAVRQGRVDLTELAEKVRAEVGTALGSNGR